MTVSKDIQHNFILSGRVDYCSDIILAYENLENIHISILEIKDKSVITLMQFDKEVCSEEYLSCLSFLDALRTT